MSTFSWPAYPKSIPEFVALMAAMDESLANEGLEPWQRPLHIGRKLWQGLGWSGNVLPPRELAQRPGFDGDVLAAKAHAWFEATYGYRLKGDWSAYGFGPARLGNALWRVRAGRVFGSVKLFVDPNLEHSGVQLGRPGNPATFNVLREIDGLPQGLASSLSLAALKEYFEFYVFMHQSLAWRDGLPKTDLFTMARADYDESTASVLGRRNNQALWAAQQAVEKTLKGLLKLAGTPYPTGGPNGHNLKHVAKLLEDNHGISISPTLLDVTACSPGVRYGEEPVSDARALAANHAVLGVLEQLRVSPKVAPLLKTAIP